MMDLVEMDLHDRCRQMQTDAEVFFSQTDAEASATPLGWAVPFGWVCTTPVGCARYLLRLSFLQGQMECRPGLAVRSSSPKKNTVVSIFFLVG